jgi:murein DD-endopeptidase MepM/ murein hydrolase activator NlpD
MTPGRRFCHALLLVSCSAIATALPCLAREAPPLTPAGNFYPTRTAYERDTNFGSCGGPVYPGARHLGSDLKAEVGDPVFAVADGMVVARSGPGLASGWGFGSYGLAVRHFSPRGEFIAIYGHIQTSLFIGSLVFAGQPLGSIGRYYKGWFDAEQGETIYVEHGAHLHFGIIKPGGALPQRGWGRLPDADCAGAGTAEGFVPPIAWINGQWVEPVAAEVQAGEDDDQAESREEPEQNPQGATRPRVVGRPATQRDKEPKEQRLF